jgi:hypothetical protein
VCIVKEMGHTHLDLEYHVDLFSLPLILVATLVVNLSMKE